MSLQGFPTKGRIVHLGTGMNFWYNTPLMSMSHEREGLSPIDRSRYQGTFLLDATIRTLLDFEGGKPPTILGTISATSTDRRVKSVAILVNAYGLRSNQAAIQPRVDKIYDKIKQAVANLPQEVLADEVTRPNPVRHRQSWFLDTSVIAFEETNGDVETAVFVCITPDDHEAQRMLEVIQEEQAAVEQGKKRIFGLARSLR